MAEDDREQAKPVDAPPIGEWDRPPLHLHVGLVVGRESVRAGALWLVEAPAVRLAVFSNPILVRVDVGKKPLIVESRPDPRIAYGIATEGSGHSVASSDEGTLYVPVPFSVASDLDDVRIRVTDIAGVELPPLDAPRAALLFDQPPRGMREIFEITGAALRETDDWPPTIHRIERLAAGSIGP